MYRLNNSLKELKTSLSLAKPETEGEKVAIAEKISLALEEENTFTRIKQQTHLTITNLEAKIKTIEQGNETYLQRIELIHQRLVE